MCSMAAQVAAECSRAASAQQVGEARLLALRSQLAQAAAAETAVAGAHLRLRRCRCLGVHTHTTLAPAPTLTC